MSSNTSHIVVAPVVSTDSNSPEAKMARDAKRLEAQSDTDAKFDTVLERFVDVSQCIDSTLLIGVAAFAYLIYIKAAKRR